MENEPLALVPGPLRNSRQARQAEVAVLKILCRLLGHNPHKLFVVWFVTFTGAVFSHAFGHKLLPAVQLAVTDLQRQMRHFQKFKQTVKMVGQLLLLLYFF